MNQVNLYKSSIVGVLILLFVYPTLSANRLQVRQCYGINAYDQLTTDSYQLYYLIFQNDTYELWYVDDLGQYDTGYRINQVGVIARLSPNGENLLIVYTEDETTHIEIVRLSDLSVENWIVSSETGVSHSPATAVWVDNQHIGFEVVLEQQLFIQNINTKDYRIIAYPELVNFDPQEDFLLFSPDFNFVLYPEAEDESQAIRTYRMIERQTLRTIQSFSGYNPVWAINSEYVNFWTADGGLGIVSIDGQIEVVEVLVEDFEFVSASANTNGYAVASGYFVPRPALPTAVILVIDMSSGEATDICSYGEIVYPSIGRFNDHLALWTADGSQFAYLMQTFLGYRIFVANIAEANSIVITPTAEGIPILLGWVSR